MSGAVYQYHDPYGKFYHGAVRAGGKCGQPGGAQLHGGGYIATMKNAYRSFAALYSELGGNCRVLTIDYRVAPEHPYPAALEDTIAAYHWLLEQGYPAEKIVVAGDSAGGGLALALCLWLKNHKEPLPSV